MKSSREIGMIVSGSLSQGLEMRLAPGEPVEELRAGMFVIINGQRHNVSSRLVLDQHPDCR